LAPKVKQALAHYVEASLFDEERVVREVKALGVRFDRIECLWEPFVELAARLREELDVPGMRLDVARGFRDKELMKRRVEAAGLRVPHHFRARTKEEVWAAADKVGFPLIVKPIAGAGSADTYRVNDGAELDAVIAKTGHVQEVSVEEFVDGEEFTFDTVCVDGKPRYFNIAQYLPRPLVARSNEWISPLIVALRDVHEPKYRDGVRLGLGVLEALGMGDGFTHMEWYRKSNGEVVFGEIGARNGGAHLVDQMNYTADVDLYREWARAVCWKSFEAKVERKYNAAIVFKRALGQGRITRIDGLDAFMRRFGDAVVAERLLRPGEHRRNWIQTLVSDGFVIVRHPDLATCLRIGEAAQTDITLYAGG
ncbi:MAG: ATP-grasp domain-containing protein, partial [Myxococcota bacterium]